MEIVSELVQWFFILAALIAAGRAIQEGEKQNQKLSRELDELAGKVRSRAVDQLRGVYPGAN